MWSQSFFILLGVFVALSDQAILIEKLTKPCDAQAADFNECAKTSFDSFMKKATSDIKELGLLNLDPMRIPFISLSKANEFSFNFSNVDFKGCSKSEITKFNWDFKKSEIHYEMKIPYVELTGGYQINGKLLVLKLEGEGPIFMNSTNLIVDGALQFDSKTEEKNGKHHLKLQKVSTKFIPDLKSAYVRADNLFNDKEISESLNIAFNDNIEGFLAELLGPVNEAFPIFLKAVLDNFFKKVPMEELMLNPIIN